MVLDRGRELSGVVHEGESWAAAARRTCASMHTEPEPLDLSGEVKRFVVDHDTRLAIRAMTRGDLPDVTRWRAAEHVRTWFTPEEPTPEAMAAKQVPEEIATRLLDRFEEVGLIDDAAFARLWVDQRQSADGKGLARRALAQELRRKGIDDETAREALDEIDPGAEEESARALVRRKLRSLSRYDDTTATRRLVGMLARKGYSSGLAFSVVRDELAQAGRQCPGGD